MTSQKDDVMGEITSWQEDDVFALRWCCSGMMSWQKDDVTEAG